MKNFITLIAVTFFLTGCTYFTRPLDHPVIEEKLNKSLFSPAKVGTLSLTPERRVVLVNFSNNRFCAEAPTEVGIDAAAVSKIAAALSQGDKSKAEVEALLASTNKNFALNKRTQGMQLFLANSYFTCQMYMNGGIDEKQLLEMQFQTLKIIEPLIGQELKYLYGSKDEEGDVKKGEGEQSPQGDVIRKSARDATEAVLKEKSAKPNEAPKPDAP